MGDFHGRAVSLREGFCFSPMWILILKKPLLVLSLSKLIPIRKGNMSWHVATKNCPPKRCPKPRNQGATFSWKTLLSPTISGVTWTGWGVDGSWKLEFPQKSPSFQATKKKNTRKTRVTSSLVGGWTNPIWKISYSQIGSSSTSSGEN